MVKQLMAEPPITTSLVGLFSLFIIASYLVHPTLIAQLVREDFNDAFIYTIHSMCMPSFLKL